MSQPEQDMAEGRPVSGTASVSDILSLNIRGSPSFITNQTTLGLAALVGRSGRGMSRYHACLLEDSHCVSVVCRLSRHP